MYKPSTAEFLLNNYVEENIQSALFPLNFVATMFFFRKYKMADNFITPNSRNYEVFAFVYIILLFNIHLIHSMNGIFGFQHDVLTYFIYFGLIFYATSFVILFISNIYLSLDNVDFVLHILQAHRVFKYQQESFKTVRRINWFFVALVFCCYFVTLITTLNYSTLGYVAIVEIMYTFSYMYFDGNLLFAFCTMKLLNLEINLWRDEVKVYLESSAQHQASGLYNEEMEAHWKNIFRAYFKILQGFNSYKKIFQPMVLYLLIEAFTSSLIYVMFLIVLSEKITIEISMIPFLSTRVLSCLWIFKDFVFLFAFVSECETFYINVKSAGALSTAALHNPVSDEAKRACKNVNRMNRLFEQMTVFEMYTVNVSLAFNLATTVTDYIVVMLQFALQKRLTNTTTESAA